MKKQKTYAAIFNFLVSDTLFNMREYYRYLILVILSH
jgi:hypothetical protein